MENIGSSWEASQEQLWAADLHSGGHNDLDDVLVTLLHGEAPLTGIPH